MQMTVKLSKYLIESIDECSEKVAYLLQTEN